MKKKTTKPRTPARPTKRPAADVNFYRMGPDLNGLQVFIKRASHFEGHESLKLGQALRKGTRGPFLFKMEVEDEDEAFTMPSFDTAGPLFSNALVQTLQALGVSNLEVFPAVIENLSDGTVNTDYSAVNVVGLVSSPKAAKGLLIFRLTDSPSTLLVSESVVDAIVEGGFEGIVFE